MRIIRRQRPIPAALVRGFYDRLAESLNTVQTTLPDFYRQAWPIIEPGTPYLHNWHIDAIAEHLEAVTRGDLRRLVINMPPRYGKSNLVSVAWPDWSWVLKPTLRWMFASYSNSLSLKHSVDRRTIIRSAWYQQRWADRFQLADDQDTKAEFLNSERGVMVATSVGGTVTGKGADIIVVDDILDPRKAMSELERGTALTFLDQTLSTRLNDKKRGAIVLIEHRLHEADATAHVIKQGGWTHLSLPAEAEHAHDIVLPGSKRVIHREPGDLLWPEREGPTEIAQQKRVMGSWGYATQYQQRPTPIGGGIIKRGWWKFFKGPIDPRFVLRSFWSLDTAIKTGEENDYSALQLWTETTMGFFLRRRIKERLEYPDLKKLVEAMFKVHPASAILIEDKSSGESLIQDLRRTTSLPVIAVEVHKDKVTRAQLVSPVIEAGRCYLPEGEDWVGDFIEECAAFPAGAHDDDVDSMTQALTYMALGSGRPYAALSAGNLTTPAPEWAR